MDEPYAGICGITEDEIRTQMKEDVDRFAKRLGITGNEVLAKLKENYDGYHFTYPSPDIYNPFSLLNFYVDVEVRTPRGRVDIVLRTQSTLYLMELKLDKSAVAAMEQINLKNYPERFALCGLPLVKVAINFDSESCTLGDWKIERT